ncbi:phenylalanine ammonia-lyase [Puccinia sorghi]|uniref:Phenylalanine ammonia-lyase n=1 Tax=Puccinia sorghi TaxID=27349 RepID=A0A0L6VIK4_9BASI|nr:phenylalanine ammonia-lyase [Puccinia sorghi]
MNKVFELILSKMMGDLFSEVVEDSFGFQLSKSSMEGMVMGIIDWFWKFQDKTGWRSRCKMDLIYSVVDCGGIQAGKEEDFSEIASWPACGLKAWTTQRVMWKIKAFKAVHSIDGIVYQPIEGP